MPMVAFALIAISKPASTSALSRAIGTPAIVNACPVLRNANASNGELSLGMEVTPPGDAVNDDFDLALEVLSAARRQAIVTRAAVFFSSAPLARNPALDEHPLESGIKRPFFDLQNVGRSRLDGSGDDCVPFVDWIKNRPPSVLTKIPSFRAADCRGGRTSGSIAGVPSSVPSTMSCNLTRVG